MLDTDIQEYEYLAGILAAFGVIFIYRVFFVVKIFGNPAAASATI